MKVFLGALLVAWSAAAAGQFQSGEDQVALVELYTSQGCSSCPRAEALLGRLRDDGRLWQAVVPVAFHVDYWDRLGWPDPFASPRFTRRQRRFAARAQEGRVYTPNFAVNGREWRGYFRGEPLALGAAAKPGVLAVQVGGDGRAEARFIAADSTLGALEVHLAVLGVGLVTEVRAGENRGRRLPQDFVALGLETWPLAGEGAVYRGAGPLAVPEIAGRLALAAWVTRAGALEPLQATGGWLDGGAPADSLHRAGGAVY